MRAVIGIVNYYRDMWAKRTHLLHPLTALTSHKVRFKCTDLEQKLFDYIKRAVSQDILLVYPYFNERFDIHTDAINYELGAAISHNGKTIAFYSRKLTGPQIRYTVTEKKLLSIVQTLKDFCTILLGQELKIYTSHKNLICKNFITYRVFQWRLILEEYSPDIEYIPGNKKIVAYALSRLPINRSQNTTHQSIYTTETMLKLYDIKELLNGTSSPSFNIINFYQQEDPFRTEKNAQNIKKAIFAVARTLSNS